MEGWFHLPPSTGFRALLFEPAFHFVFNLFVKTEVDLILDSFPQVDKVGAFCVLDNDLITCPDESKGRL